MSNPKRAARRKSPRSTSLRGRRGAIAGSEPGTPNPVPRLAASLQVSPASERTPSWMGGGAAIPAFLPLGLWGIWAVVALAYLSYGWAGAFAGWSDEAIHRYVATRVAAGEILYRDVSSARPPFVILSLAFLLKLGLPSLLAAKLLVMGTHLGTAALLWLGGQRLFSPRAAALSSIFYLLSAQTLARSDYTGIQWVAFGGTLLVYLALRQRPHASGIAAGIALACGQHVAVLAGLAPLLFLWRGGWAAWRDVLRYALSALAVLVVVFGSAFFLGGEALFHDLVGKHLYHVTQSKTSSGLDWWIALFAWDDLWLYALVGFGAFATRPRGQKDNARALFVLAGAHLAVVMWMSGGLILYVFPSLPLFAWVAGVGAHRLWTRFETPQGIWRKASWRWGCVGALGLSMLLGFGQARGMLETRDKESYSLLPHLRYLELSRLQKLSAVDDVATYARALPQGETVFGYPTLVSAVALASGRRVAGELADLAPRWFRTGAVKPEDVIAAIEADQVGLFVSHKHGIDRGLEGYLSRCYEKPNVVPRVSGDGNGIPDLYVFRHKEGARPCL